jgi:iron(III) transport system substrate-binding protein
LSKTCPSKRSNFRFFSAVVGGAAFGLLPAGCDRSRGSDSAVVVAYTSVDEPFARQVFDEFERGTGVRVEALYDTEGGKTTGFVRRLQREASRPQCDVWWSGEVFGTIELARAGLLEAYESPAAADIPPAWKDPKHRWTGSAARVRVLAYHTQRVRPGDLPATWRDLADTRWTNRLALANPQFGTTRGHLAAIFAYEGTDFGRAFVQLLRDGGAQIADGNSHAVRLVLGGAADICATDSDDVWVAQRRGEPIGLIYLRLDADHPPLWIPCSTAVVRGGPNPAAARRLADFLNSAEVERLLARSDSRNVPVRETLRAELGIAGSAPEPVDFERVADALPAAMVATREILLR